MRLRDDGSSQLGWSMLTADVMTAASAGVARPYATAHICSMASGYSVAQSVVVRAPDADTDQSNDPVALSQSRWAPFQTRRASITLRWASAPSPTASASCDAASSPSYTSALSMRYFAFHVGLAHVRPSTSCVDSIAPTALTM